VPVSRENQQSLRYK